MEKEIGKLFEDAFSEIKSNEYIELESSRTDPNLGRENLPSPHLKIDTEDVTCPDCGFEYAVEQGIEKNSKCPVCR